MSNIIPPLLSSTPPPIGNIEEDDDEFGDFTTAVNHSYGCDALSIPNTPTKLPIVHDVDINSNSNTIEDLKIVLDDETEVEQRPKTDVQSVPNIPKNDIVQLIEENLTNSVPDNDDFNDHQEVLNVPSCPTPTEIDDDVYREEPPDIISDDEEEEDEEESVEEESDKCDKKSGLREKNFEFIDDFADFKSSEDEMVSRVECENKTHFVGISEINVENSIVASEFNLEKSVVASEINVDENPVEFEDFANFKNPDIDDFGDFTTVDYEPKTQPEKLPEQPKIPGTNKENVNNLDDDDDFGDFDDFTTSSAIPPVASENILLLNSADAFDKAKYIIEQMFLPMDLIAYDYDLGDFIAEDYIFKEIKDVTDTNALTYQWAKSESQKGLLKSLKIDTRNILFGHGRNASMPKFAANLGLAPLEPTKSEFLTPTTPPTTTSSTPPLNPSAPTIAQQPITPNQNAENIPSAQFDWNESGLANPLDSVSKDPEPDMSADIISSTKQFDTESVNSLQFADIPAEVDVDVTKVDADNLDDFTSFQKSDGFNNTNWNNMVPLRETHINSIENKKVEMEEPGWLKPTILTPILTRNVKIGITDLKEKNYDYSRVDGVRDDFGGFQSSELKKTEFEANEFGRFGSIDKETKDLKENQDFTNFDLSTQNTLNTDVKNDTMQDFTSFGLTESKVAQDKPNNTVIQDCTDFTSFAGPCLKNDLNKPLDTDEFKTNNTLDFGSSISKIGGLNDIKLKDDKAQDMQDFVGFGPPITKQKDFTAFNSVQTKTNFGDSKQKKFKDDDDFDDFTSFQTSPKEVGPPQTKTKESFQHNILQPSILQPIPTYSAPAQINWPDPGVTDEELARFYMFSQKTEFKTETPKSKELEKSPPVQRLSGTTGLLLVEKSVVVPANKVVLPSKEILLPPNNKVVISKDLVLPILESSPRKYTPNKVKNDEDDWSDFVSSSDVKTERISTPELSLCIPQLSNIQPPKLPIPVITAHGLMQTKIPSTIPTQKPATHQPLHVNPPTDGYQPSIISNQFAMQLNQNLFQTTNIPSKTSPYHKPQNGIKTISNSDDEWSDFVSSRPVGNNVFNRNWGNAQTNIISNPTANYQTQGSLNGMVKRNIPSISSLPELDFVATNSRSFKSKK